MAKMKWYEIVAWLLLIIGAINWGLIGTFHWNLVGTLFGVGTLTDVIYALVGIAGVYGLMTFVKLSKK